jgi:hypothetical protein
LISQPDALSYCDEMNMPVFHRRRPGLNRDQLAVSKHHHCSFFNQ